MDWTRKYDRKEEGDKLFDYLRLRETIAHTDLRPENILYCDHDGVRHFSLCDLSDLRRGPADLDLVSLLMDPRLAGIFSMEEIRAINDHHHAGLVDRYGAQLSKEYKPKDRFTLAAVHVLLDDIGSVTTHLKQINPQGGDINTLEGFEQGEVEKMGPLGNVAEYFARQYLSLFRVLGSSDLFPHLRKGISAFAPEPQRRALEARLHIDHPNILWRSLSSAWNAGRRWLSSSKNRMSSFNL